MYGQTQYSRDSISDSVVNAARALVRRVVVYGRRIGPRWDSMIRNRLVSFSATANWDEDAIVEEIAQEIAPMLRPVSSPDTVTLATAETQWL